MGFANGEMIGYNAIVNAVKKGGCSMAQDQLLSVVVPMYFEEAVARECYARLTQVLAPLMPYELIFVNDGSTDQTLPILRELAAEDAHVKVIGFSRNFGHQAAVTAGVKRARGDAIVIIDADLQDPPEVIPEMVTLWQAGNDVVYAKRKKREGESVFKLLTAKLFYRTLKALTDTDIPADTGDFRLMDRKVAMAFNKMPEHNRFIRGMVSWLGYKQVPLEYVRHERFAGETKYPLRKMLKLASDGVLSFSLRPLNWVLGLGMVSVVVALLILLYSLISLWTGHATQPGWVSTMVTVTFLGGVQLLSIGVVGAYVGRIYEEVRSRPLYLEDELINFENPQP